MPLFERWKVFKEEIKMTAIERSSQISHQARVRERKLEEDLKLLCQLECDNPGVGMKDIDYIKAQINEICEDRFRGAVVQARADRFLFGERPMRRALSGKIKYALSKEINTLECGPIVSADKVAIEATFVQHYKLLFTPINSSFNTDTLRDMLESMPKLSDEQRMGIEGPIDIAEIENAIDSPPSKKSTGPDGLGDEFYKHYKSRNSPILLQLYLHAY